MVESFLSFDILSGVTIDLLRIILAQLKNVLQILRLNGNNATCSFDFRFSLSLSAAAPLHRSMRVMGDSCVNQSSLFLVDCTLSTCQRTGSNLVTDALP